MADDKENHHLFSRPEGIANVFNRDTIGRIDVHTVDGGICRISVAVFTEPNPLACTDRPSLRHELAVPVYLSLEAYA